MSNVNYITLAIAMANSRLAPNSVATGSVEFLISKKSHMLSGTDVVADFSESNSFRI